MHFAEKGSTAEIGHLPHPTHTYELTKTGFGGKEVWVIPELEANLNLTARCEMLAENYTGIPVVIDMFEGGDKSTPNVMLNTGDLEKIMQLANVTAIRIPELISWYMNRSITNSSVWIDWVHRTFDFALDHNLTIYWSDWKLGSDIEALTKTTLAGYEDKIIYLYQTNNGFQIPLIGYLYARTFPHWGASVQSWYVDESGENQWDLPEDMVVEYITVARNMGAEIIQFEPYWYFFDDNGEPKNIMTTLSTII